jgi:autotransporter-associated beta strand protein
MKHKNRFLFPAILSVALVTGASVHAADKTWSTEDEGDGLWSNADNWGGATPLVNDTLIFGATDGTTTLTHDLPNTFSWAAGSLTGQTNFRTLGITFNSDAPAYTINGNGTGSTSLTVNGTITVNSASDITQTINSNVTATSGLTVTGAGNLTLAGNYNRLGTWQGPLTKNGTGVLTLSGNAGQNGLVTVREGTLRVASTGSITATSGITIGTASTSAVAEFNYNSSTALTRTITFAAGSSGGILSGSGTINTAVNVTTGNTLAIGNSPGQMNFANTLTLAGTTEMEIDGTAGAGVTGGHDFANLTGAGAAGVITYGGILLLDMGAIFSEGIYTWNLFDFASETGTFSTVALDGAYSGSLLDGDADGIWDLTDLDGNIWQFTESTGVLGLTAIPEPSAALLGSLGMLCLLRRRR